LRAKAAGKTIFLSSHLLSEVENICDRVAFLVKGKIAKLGTPAELLETKGRVEIVARKVEAAAVKADMVSSINGLVRFGVEKTRSREIVESIWRQGGEIVSLNPVRTSLEEMFLELAQAADHKKEEA
jgi:ABC-2 type transport system ATP-binding protein